MEREFEMILQQSLEHHLKFRSIGFPELLLGIAGSTFRTHRLNIESGKFTEYQLPHYTNVRRVFVDNNTTPPTFWVGNNHGAALIKVEPQD